MNRMIWSAVPLLVCGLMAGCGGGGSKDLGPTGKVDGAVTLDGNPLSAGSVAFYQSDTGQSGGGQIGADGKFKFDYPVPIGKYQVSFQPPAPPTPDELEPGKAIEQSTDIAPAYQDGSTSGITADVKEGPNSFTFELTKRGPQGVTPP
ncbi:MAG: hypothetical protein KDA89_20465 [Planctomycetaceae bacterium]|nr:hypothetical protein [Planctomycetaceae bacterium]